MLRVGENWRIWVKGVGCRVLDVGCEEDVGGGGGGDGGGGGGLASQG